MKLSLNRVCMASCGGMVIEMRSSVCGRRWQSGMRDDWEWDPKRDADGKFGKRSRDSELGEASLHTKGAMKRVVGADGQESWQLVEEVEVSAS